MRASKAQRDRTVSEEGWLLRAYKDTLGIWTIGAGHAATNPIPVRGLLNNEYYEGPPTEGLTISADEAQRLYDLDTETTERGISSLVTAPLTQNQFDALFDFVHQFGLGALGGSTLITKLNKNPNNLGDAATDNGILHELMRWTRAGGEHQEYVWRRSARRACVYAGTPIPQALWRKNGFPFAVNAETDKIDYSITPTIYKLIEYGKKAAEPYKFEPDKIKIEARPQDELVLDKPVPPTAEPSAAVSKEAAPAPATQPAPGSASPVSKPEPAKPSNSPQAPVSATVEAPKAAAPASPLPAPRPVPLPPVPAPPPPSDALPADLADPKDMVMSRRFWGLFITGVSTLNFLPRGVQEWMANQGNRELLSWLVLVVVGVVLYQWGKKKAKRPLK